MWPDRVSNPGPLTYEPGAPLTALRGPAHGIGDCTVCHLPELCQAEKCLWHLCAI